MSIRFSHLFTSSTSGSGEPGRLSDVKPPARVHGGLPRHAWILKARSRLYVRRRGRGQQEIYWHLEKYKALNEHKDRSQRGGEYFELKCNEQSHNNNKKKSSLPPFDKESVLLILTTSIIQIWRYDGVMINRTFSFWVKFMKANPCGRFRQ